MRRSICYCEPQVARAGQATTWHFYYTPSHVLSEGAKIRFDLQSYGRDIDWQLPSSDLSESANVIYVLLEDEEILEADEVDVPGSAVPLFEFTLPRSVKAGEKIIIILGAPHGSNAQDEELGNESQLTAQRRKAFYLYVDPKGKGNFEEPEIFTLDIRGAKLANIRILTPSFASKNKRFDITVRFEDEFGNLTNHAPEGTLIELTYEHLRENLNWKLFVPETGFVVLPNLYFNEAGVYRVQLTNVQNKQLFFSAPIKCFQEPCKNLLWGLFHGESERIDATENIESCLRHFRDEKAYNFFASSNFDSIEETSNDMWKHVSQNLAEFNEEDRFITLLGFQYVGEKVKEGVRQFVYHRENKPIFRSSDAKSNQIEKVYRMFPAKEGIAIPSFTMCAACCYDFKNFDPNLERLVEIYNAWGSSECPKEEGNLFPITGLYEEDKRGSIRLALKNNYRFGFVAGGLDDRGLYAKLFDSKQVQYQPGLTAVIADKYSKDALFDAIYQRRTYATTGARIIVGFYIAGCVMGSEIGVDKKPGLMVNRHISGYVAGTTALKKVEIIRNGDVIHSFKPSSYHLDYHFDDLDPLTEVVLEHKSTKFAFYYLRVIQEDGHVAWSSPIWIDLLKGKTT